MLRTLVASFSSSPAAALGAFPSLPLAPPVRSMVAGALATAVRVGGWAALQCSGVAYGHSCNGRAAPPTAVCCA